MHHRPSSRQHGKLHEWSASSAVTFGKCSVGHEVVQKKHLKQDQIALIHTDSWIAARGSYHYTATVQGSFYSPLSGPICSNHRSTKRHLERIPSPRRALSCTTKKNLQIWLAPTEIHKASNRLYVFFHIGMHVHINYIEIYICTDP